MKYFLRAALSLLIVLGVAVALWPLGQAAYARWSQSNLRAQWRAAATHNKGETIASRRTTRVRASAQTERRSKAQAGKSASGASSAAASSAAASSAAASSAAASSVTASTQTISGSRKWPPTRIIAPDIGLDAVVVSDVSESALRRGPGHWPGSALPGQAGNCVIAGHRNVYGSHFYRVDEALPGSLITLRTPDDSFDYQVLQSYTVADTDVSVLQPPAQKDAPPQLTLITCTIRRTTTRIIIVAQLVPPEEKY